MLRRTATLLLLLPLAANAFVAPSGWTAAGISGPSSSTSGDCQSSPSTCRHVPQQWSTAIHSSNDDGGDAAPTSRRRRKAAGLDPEMRSKLLSESIAPWRTVRLFLYVAAGSGAFLGGLITLSGVAAALSGARTDVDLNTEVGDTLGWASWNCEGRTDGAKWHIFVFKLYLYNGISIYSLNTFLVDCIFKLQYVNLAIDFGAVLAFVLAYRFDIGKAAELNENVSAKLEAKKDSKKIAAAMKEREATIANLKVNVRVSDDGTQMKEATVKEVQTGAKQHLIIVVGERSAIKDALFSAKLVDFAVRDVLIVPYELAIDAEKATRPTGGFGQRPSWESAPYVADPSGAEWDAYVNEELQDAIKQNGEGVRKDGIAIVVKNTGSVVRRGVGKVPWRDMVEELEEKKKDEVEIADLRFLSPE